MTGVKGLGHTICVLLRGRRGGAFGAVTAMNPYISIEGEGSCSFPAYQRLHPGVELFQSLNCYSRILTCNICCAMVMSISNIKAPMPNAAAKISLDAGVFLYEFGLMFLSGHYLFLLKKI